MESKASAPNLYPDIGYALSQERNDGNHFRLYEISRIKDTLQNEIIERRKLYKRYKKAYNIIQGVGSSSGSLSGVTSIATISTLVTGVGIPVGIALGGISCGLGGIAAGCGITNKFLLRKLQKHEKIVTLAQSKLDSIAVLLSKAFIDDQISDEEFKFIMNEVTNYQKLKQDIKNNVRKDISDGKEKWIQEGIQKGKELVRKELAGKLK